MHQDLKKYLHHPVVIETYNKYNALCTDTNKPHLNYFGINFDKNGIASFKFYFAFFKKLELHEIKQFLPITFDFLKYYHLWEESNYKSIEHSGCTFEVKFKPDMTPIYGFHYRLPPTKESYDLIGYPKLLPFNVLDLNTRPGINYEYCNDTVLRKQYYYLDSLEHKKYFAQRFNNPFINKLNLIEYTESDLFSKINGWRIDHTPENLKRPNVHTDYANEIFSSLYKDYNLINISDGYYENNETRASYFFNIKHTSEAPYDDSENFHVDTMKLFL